MNSNGLQPVQVNAYNTNAQGFRIIQRSNNPLSLWTNTTERLTIDGNGFVGIGTASPVSRLSVNGTADFQTRIGFNNKTQHFGDGTMFINTINGINDLGIRNDVGDVLFASGGHTSQMFLKPSGNVGIGTSMPAYKLDVSGTSRFDYAVIGSGVQGFYQDAINGAYRANNSSSDNGFYFQNYQGASTSMYIGLTGAYAGRVGIGTVAPQSELAVKGTITSQKIKVTLKDWADYVFDSSYPLKSLSQVETYIQQNKHLPEIPTAAEVETGGIDLGTNQVLLLKKIEELTLYIIQQNKDMQEMKERIKALESTK
ncbi:hypothetical protein FLA_4305 [Filimonas lacunae]|nr:hypothetical protein FLA_4305 [Filimonas lacunae]